MKTKTRGNGQGTAYKRGRTWEAQVIVGYKDSNVPGGQRVPIKRRKGGFKTKAEAIAACATLGRSLSVTARMTLQEVYDAWEASYSPRVGVSTMNGYSAAYKHYSSLANTYIDMITARDLQRCMDACPAGKRTHQLMKVVARLLWAYAVDAEIVQKDVTENLYTGKGQSVHREPLTDSEVETIRKAIGKEPYADYVYALCYLGFRPGEFLELKKSSLTIKDGALVLIGGKKTEAGRNRNVLIPPVIGPIIAERMQAEGTDLLFPMRATNRKGEFTGYKKMTDSYFRESVFKPLMKRLGIADGKVPYSARHTYADKLKEADGQDKAKAALMGHTDYRFTQTAYQSTDINDLKKVITSLK